MESIKNILSFIHKAWNFISIKISAAWWWLLDATFRLLIKIFGEERVEKSFIAFYQKINSFKTNFKARFDTEGQYFPALKKIYKFSIYLLIGAFAYWFCLKTNFLWLTGNMPSIEQLQDPKVAQSSTIMTADGVAIGKFFEENRTTVDSSQISPWLYKALIATEDVRFYQHSGIDLKSLAGVAVGLFTGGERGGGSTVSQQLAKNLYNTRKREMRGILSFIPVIKTIVYKTKEWLTAIALERNFTKGEILTMYLNTVDYGNNAYGIKTAAKTYFNKEPDKLTIEESAVLVGLQKGTTLYNPIRNPKNAFNRRNTVLQLMAKSKYITETKADNLCKKEINLDVNFDDTIDGQGSYFKVALSRFVEKWAKDNEIDIDLYKDGLKIYTTIDSRMQTHAENSVAEKMKALQKAFDAHWGNKNPWAYEDGTEIPGFIDTVAKRTNYYKSLMLKFKKKPDSVDFYMNKPHKIKVFSWNGDKVMTMSAMDSIRYYKKFLQCGMMAMDPYSGFIKAWVGGINYDYFKYDHVKQGRRQPGSTFKPILYCSAIDGPLNLSPCDRRQDKPYKAEWKENGVTKTWEPKNAGGNFTYANLTLRQAIARSVNSVAAQVTSEVKPRMVVEYARKLGITSPLDPVGSIGLGTSEVTLYELVAAYGVFPNKGNYTEPMLVFKIEDAKGKVLFEFEPKKRPNVIKEESAFLMEFMMRGGVEEAGGTGHGLYNYNIFDNGGQVAGKTGTTSNYSDAWYVGYTKDLVCGVWVGGDDRSIHFRGSMGEGGHSALPVFGRFMEKVYNDKKLDYKSGPFPKPSIPITKSYEGCAGIARDEIEIDTTATTEEEIPDTTRRLQITTPELIKRKDSLKKEKEEQL
jgi:penicillin-binding protein 1A